MSLYRKYRPMNFDSLLGQDHVCEVLKGALKKEKVSHAYLLTGPRGTGKTSSARILARAINCEKLTDSGPCNECEICQAALEERLTDVIEIDAASHGLVDDARAMVEQAKFMPVQAKKKIYIIDEVHMLSKSAFNALLKIIEEPPEHVHFILATTESHKVIETIKSRCQRFDFHLADEATLIEHMKDVCNFEKVKPTQEALEILAKYARGSFRDALSLLEQVMNEEGIDEESVKNTLGLSDQASIKEFVECIKNSDQIRAITLVGELTHQGHDMHQFCQSVLSFLREILLKNSNSKDTLRYIEVFFAALNQLRDPLLPELPLEIAVIKAISENNDKTVAELPKQTENVEKSKQIERKNEVKSVPTKSNKENNDQSTNEKPLDIEFSAENYLSKVKPAALRTILKYSQMQLHESNLNISVRSTFELEKVKNKQNVWYLEKAWKIFQEEVKLVLASILKK